MAILQNWVFHETTISEIGNGIRPFINGCFGIQASINGHSKLSHVEPELHHLRPMGGCTKAKVHMSWKDDGALTWSGQIAESSARPWQDLSLWPSASKTAPKCPASLGGGRGEGL